MKQNEKKKLWRGSESYPVVARNEEECAKNFQRGKGRGVGAVSCACLHHSSRVDTAATVATPTRRKNGLSCTRRKRGLSEQRVRLILRLVCIDPPPPLRKELERIDF